MAPYRPYDLDDLFACLGSIGVFALKARDRRVRLQEADLLRLVFVCALDTEFTLIGFG